MAATEDRNSIFDFADWDRRPLPRYEDDEDVEKEDELLREAADDPESLLPWLLEEAYLEQQHPRRRPGVPGGGRWIPNPNALWRRYATLGQEENRARMETRDVEQKLLRDWIEKHGAEEEGASLHYADVEGEQHVHSRYSDGHATIEELAEQAIRAGHKHLTISDHSDQMTPEKIERQHAEIDRLNEKYQGRLRIVKGIEANIQEDGTLDMPATQLGRFEQVNVGIHAGKSDHAMARLMRALDDPHVHVLAHPHTSSGLDYDALAKKAAAKGVALEVNSRDILRGGRQSAAAQMIRAARRYGAKLQFASDAHTEGDFIDTRYGVALAAAEGVTPDLLYRGAHKQ